MKNVEPQKNEADRETDWSKTPLFSQNVAPQKTNNAALQISSLTLPENLKTEPLPEFNVEPQKIPAPVAVSLSLKNATFPDLENGLENVELRQKESVGLLNIEKPLRYKKRVKKLPPKKIYSQKREVVPAKIFVSPAEKTALEKRAKESGCSLSNFIRLYLGLPLNEIGRKKHLVIPAFDLKDLELDLE